MRLRHDKASRRSADSAGRGAASRDEKPSARLYYRPDLAAVAPSVRVSGFKSEAARRITAGNGRSQGGNDKHERNHQPGDKCRVPICSSQAHKTNQRRQERSSPFPLHPHPPLPHSHGINLKYSRAKKGQTVKIEGAQMKQKTAARPVKSGGVR